MKFKEWLKLNENQDVVRIRRTRPDNMSFANPLSHLPQPLSNIGGAAIGTVGSTMSGLLRKAMADTGHERANLHFTDFGGNHQQDDDEDYSYSVTVNRNETNGDLRNTAIVKATSWPEVQQLISKKLIDPRYVNAQKEFDNGTDVTFIVRFSKVGATGKRLTDYPSSGTMPPATASAPTPKVVI